MVTSPRLVALLAVGFMGHASIDPTPPAFAAQAANGMPQESQCVRGRTLRWTWTEGPTAGVTHEHEFRTDGTVLWRVLSGSQEGHTAVEKEYSAFDVSEEVCVVSYLAASGYTLTVVLNTTSGDMYGFASNDEVWLPGRGRFEVVR